MFKSPKPKDTEVYIWWHLEAKGQCHFLQVQAADVKDVLEVMRGVSPDVALVG